MPDCCARSPTNTPMKVTVVFPAVTQTPEEPAMVMPAATRTLPVTGMCDSKPVTPLAVAASA